MKVIRARAANRWTLWLGVAVFLSLLAAGCGTSSGTGPQASSTGGASTSTGPVTITFAEAMSTGTQKPALDHLVQEFQKQHPNVTVQLIAQPDYGQLRAKTQAAVAAGNPPTIAQAYESWAATYAKSGAIVPLDSYIQGNGGLSQEEIKDFWPEIWQDQKLQDGKVWMMPFNKSDMVMYYNADWLKKQNIPVPGTWDQFAEASKAVTSKSNNTWGISIDPGSSSAPANGTSLYIALLRAYGGDLVKDGKITWNSPQGIQALQYLQKLYQEGALQLGTKYPGQAALGSQHAPFDLSTIASYPYNVKAVGDKFSMQVAPLPSGPAGHGNVLQGTNVVLFSKATPEQKQAAWEFMKFLAAPQQTAYWSEQTGYLPVRQSAVPMMKSYFDTHPYQKIAADSLQYAKPEPSNAGFEEAQGVLAEAITAALTGNQDASTVLNSSAQKAQQLISK